MDFRSEYVDWMRQSYQSIPHPPWTSLETELWWISYQYTTADMIRCSVSQSLRPCSHVRCLDVGAGTAPVAVSLACDTLFEIIACDIQPHPLLLRFVEDAQLPIEVIGAEACHLPFSDASFQMVLCLEVLEHLSRPKAAADEIARVLAPGGLCFLSTPPRIKFLFRRDPHYGVPFLAALPRPLREVLLRTHFGRTYGRFPEYKFHRLFWSASQVFALFDSGDFSFAIDPPNARFRWRLLTAQKRASEGE